MLAHLKRCSNMLILGMESKISLFGPPVARLWQYISMYFAIYQQKLVYSGLPQARSKTKIFSWMICIGLRLALVLNGSERRILDALGWSWVIKDDQGRPSMMLTNWIFWSTRPKSPFRRQGLPGLWGRDTVRRVHFEVFSVSHFTPTALSLGGPTDLLDVLTREGERGGNTKMSERYTFSLFAGGFQLTF